MGSKTFGGLEGQEGVLDSNRPPPLGHTNSFGAQALSAVRHVRPLLLMLCFLLSSHPELL